MKEIISKIKGIACRINQAEKTKDDIELSCYGYSKCDTCCGFDICECNDKLIKNEKP